MVVTSQKRPFNLLYCWNDHFKWIYDSFQSISSSSRNKELLNLTRPGLYFVGSQAHGACCHACSGIISKSLVSFVLFLNQKLLSCFQSARVEFFQCSLLGKWTSWTNSSKSLWPWPGTVSCASLWKLRKFEPQTLQSKHLKSPETRWFSCKTNFLEIEISKAFWKATWLLSALLLHPRNGCCDRL